MLYLILQMALLLAIASLLSAAIGWLARRFFHEKHLLERRSDEKRRARIPAQLRDCLLYTSPSPRDQRGSRMPSSA